MLEDQEAIWMMDFDGKAWLERKRIVVLQNDDSGVLGLLGIGRDRKISHGAVVLGLTDLSICGVYAKAAHRLRS